MSCWEVSSNTNMPECWGRGGNLAVTTKKLAGAEMLCSHFTVAARRDGPERGPGGNSQHTAIQGPLQPVIGYRSSPLSLMGSTKGYLHFQCDKPSIADYWLTLLLRILEGLVSNLIPMPANMIHAVCGSLLSLLKFWR
jgi:hypothetical protein